MKTAAARAYRAKPADGGPPIVSAHVRSQMDAPERMNATSQAAVDIIEATARRRR